MSMLEQIAAEIFRKVSNQLYDTPLDMRVDPYHMKIDDGKEQLLKKSETESALSPVETIRVDIDKMWLINRKIPANELAG
jgi:hypothetical protein